MDHCHRIDYRTSPNYISATSSRMPLVMHFYSLNYNLHWDVSIFLLVYVHRGYVGAGGLEKGGKFHNCTGGAARLVDVMLLGEKHIYQRPTTRAVYNTDVSFDPEGFHNWNTKASNPLIKLLFFFSSFRAAWSFDFGFVCFFGCRSSESSSYFPLE